jgi:hypothetical protein
MGHQIRSVCAVLLNGALKVDGGDRVERRIRYAADKQDLSSRPSPVRRSGGLSNRRSQHHNLMFCYARSAFTDARAAPSRRVLSLGMAPFLFQCPNTGLNVQGWSAEEIPADSGIYLTTECLACRRVHLVNPTSGRVLGSEDD